MFTQCFENVKRYISAYDYYIIIILPLEKRPSRERETCFCISSVVHIPQEIYPFVLVFTFFPPHFHPLEKNKYCVLEITELLFSLCLVTTPIRTLFEGVS